MLQNTPFEQSKNIVLSSVDWARKSINLWIREIIIPNHTTTYSIILKPQNKTCCLIHDKQDLLPIDVIDHDYKNNIHFYFIIFAPDACYEGYLYLIPPENNFHISLLFQLRGDDLQKREKWFEKVQKN